MAHSHSHSHQHHIKNKKALLVSFFIIASFVIVVFIGGLLTNSLTLLSDAGHMFSDALSLGIGLIAFKLGEKAVNSRMTFGYQRLEILAALFNGLLLVGIALIIIYEALKRFANPQEISSIGMLAVAITGAIVNIIVAYILTRADTTENINLRAAFMHVLGDLLGSVGAIIASILIMLFDWSIADPIASLLISIIILRNGIEITTISFHILMEGIPMNMDVKKIRESLLNIQGVVGMHDFHVWSITSDFPTVTCHLEIVRNEHDKVIKDALKILHDEFHIEHATIQVERVSAKHEEYEHHRCNSYT
ncbi:cation diffusion facilitator family transporter [Lysinibacillus sp. SGAir0095]|uniref:cation diffusion facilitator family transporter n=1 Tax=Lysinibacillus sp. SGAir0095 TaxID=2070463 RepID=UPI0010CD40DC|nr:cation diffusion facilitator family transporter [Lysinibacillus sp. SGAir0095]QCR32644.1 cation transporter [Lysinibacillus sp. SGAir0095]